MNYQLSDAFVLRIDDGTYIPLDAANIDYRAYLDWVAEGNTAPPYQPPPVDLQTAVVNAVQGRLDDFARTRAYDGILSACTYVTSTVPKFAAEGQCAVDARDAHWSQCYQILGEVQAGTRPMPTVDEVLAEMPALQWPA